MVEATLSAGPGGRPARYLTIRYAPTGRILVDRGFVAVCLRPAESPASQVVAACEIGWRSDEDPEPPEAQTHRKAGPGEQGVILCWPRAAGGLLRVSASFVAAGGVLLVSVEVSAGSEFQRNAGFGFPVIEEATVFGICVGENGLLTLGDALDLEGFVGGRQPHSGQEKAILFANGWQSWSRSGAAASAAEMRPAIGKVRVEELPDPETLEREAQSHVSMHNAWYYLEEAEAAGEGPRLSALLWKGLSGPLVSWGFACLARPKGAACSLLGFLDSSRYMGFIEVATDSRRAERPGLARAAVRAVVGAEAFVLAPGQIFQSGPLAVVFAGGEDAEAGVDATNVAARDAVDPNAAARAALDAYASLVAEWARKTTHRVRRPKPEPVVGWCSWYYYYNTVREEDVLENLSYLRKLAAQPGAGLPARYIQIDDGYQKGIGDWLEPNEKFPHGMAWLAHQIRAAGFIPGIWLAPFAVAGSSDLARAHPDWILRNDKGEPVHATHNWGERIFGLDCSHPEVQEWLRSLVRTIAGEWGYSYLKIDFVYAAALPGRHRQPSWTRAQAYREGLRIVGETLASVAAPDEAHLLGCGAPLLPSVGLVDGMRVSADVAPFYAPLVRNVGFPSLFEQMRGALTRQLMDRSWWQNDPDCLILRDTDTRLTEAEVYSLATLGALVGGVLFSSDRLPGLSSERLELLRRALELGRELAGTPPAVVLDPLSRPLPSLVLRRAEPGRARRRGGRRLYVAVFNWDDEPRNRTVRWRDLELGDAAVLKAKDWWSGASVGRAAGSLDVEAVAPHGVRLFELTT